MERCLISKDQIFILTVIRHASFTTDSFPMGQGQSQNEQNVSNISEQATPHHEQDTELPADNMHLTSNPPRSFSVRSNLNTSLSRKLTNYLFISHFLSTWNSRLFEMGVILFIAAIYPQTLLPVSIYALARSGAAVIFSTSMGVFIDRCDRLLVVRISIIGQRLAVAVSCGVFMMLYTRTTLSIGVRNGLFAINILLACVEKLCSIMNLVSIERDWVVVITEDDPLQRRKVNARMRRIDLFCKLVGPLTISLVDGGSTIVAIWLTLGLSCFSVGIEYFTIVKLYDAIPMLQTRNRTNVPGIESNIAISTGSRRNSIWSLLRRISAIGFNSGSLSFYIHHRAFLPSFSLALLYLTVLSLSGQMITYLLAAGYTSIHIGIARAVSTIFELSATWIAPRLQKSIGPVRGGIWSVNWEILYLTSGLVWFTIHGQNQGYQNIITASGLVAGVILSRVGLWSFDLCTQIIIQEDVEESHRGSFSTVEAAFQNLFELLSYATTIVFSKTDQFLYPSVISTAAVYIAGGLYTLYVRRRRGHLLHKPMCLKSSHA